jgi:hypothetical protein
MISVNQALQAAQNQVSHKQRSPHLLIAGATGALGNEVLRRLVGTQRYALTWVTAKHAVKLGFRAVDIAQAATENIASWPLVAAEVGVVLFDPPRMFYERERALWTPAPAQLGELAAWMRRCGVHTLAVVLPHVQGQLPEALKRGLASLDEHAVAALGFERLLIVRSAEKAQAAPPAQTLNERLHALAAWMLGTLRYMIPSSEQPVRASKVAELVDAALQQMLQEQRTGTFVAAPELVWQATQQPVRPLVSQWLAKSPHG